MKQPSAGIQALLLPGFFLLFVSFGAFPGLAAGAPDYTRLSIEELMEIEITSAAKKPQQLSKAAAAIFVITDEDIRRSGATCIPEVLRMVPGLEVARIDANKWAVTARGFNEQFANKLLVLIDGRTVYSPFFSGVSWDAQDTLLEDIDRIEVIRGPGAALWGANAVNGVINILTKNARDTQEGLLVAGTGTEELGFGKLRYGGSLGENSHYRVWGEYLNRDDGVYEKGGDADDEWDKVQGGGRLDHQAGKEHLTLQGDIFYSEQFITVNQTGLTSPFNEMTGFKSTMQGGNVIGRWNHDFSEKSNLKLQLYYDRSDRDQGFIHEIRDTGDIDLQYRFPLLEIHDVIVGAGYRVTHDDISSCYFSTIDPDSRTDELFSAYLQDAVTLIEEELLLTLGARFEHNDYSGFEVQPTIRLAWTPTPRFTLWGAASRAVRTPSRSDYSTRANFMVIPDIGGGMPAVISIFPNDDLDAERVYAFEAGIRIRPAPQLFLDATAFYNDYDNLLTFVARPPFVETSPEPAHLVIWEQKENGGDGQTWGFELALDWHPLKWWQLKAAYTFLRMNLDPGEGRWDHEEGYSPRHQISLQSRLDLGDKTTFDLWLRYVDHLPDLDIHSYFDLDARLAYQATRNLEIALVGQNLLDRRHPEFTSIFSTALIETERGVYGKLTWRF
ncbi:MAG: TonB-dependent receptor [Deltaproteobacteria bacterium]|nr:TonB-dependent receptor [Deltaproteobacteria bacterium]